MDRNQPRRHAHVLRALLARGAVFALLWAALVRGDPDGLAWGGLVVPLLLLLSLGLLPPQRPLRVLRLLGLLPLVIWKSVHGGADVAWRAMHPRLPVDPDLVVVPLPPGSRTHRILLAYLVSLLPGTLAADIGEDTLTLHVVDRRQPNVDETLALSRRISRLLGEEQA